MYCLFEKIKKCPHDLVQWGHNAFGDMRTKLGAKQQELQDLSTTDYAHNLERINSVRQEVNDLLNHEEVFWRQRSRAIWLPTRDKKTKFFHQRAS